MIAIAGRCATCKHAETIAPPRLYGGDDDAAELAQHARYPLLCKRAEMDDGKPEDPRTMAFSMDSSSYRAHLLVSPDFGCVMFEPCASPLPLADEMDASEG